MGINSADLPTFGRDALDGVEVGIPERTPERAESTSSKSSTSWPLLEKSLSTRADSRRLLVSTHRFLRQGRHVCGVLSAASLGIGEHITSSDGIICLQPFSLLATKDSLCECSHSARYGHWMFTPGAGQHWVGHFRTIRKRQAVICHGRATPLVISRKALI